MAWRDWGKWARVTRGCIPETCSPTHHCLCPPRVQIFAQHPCYHHIWPAWSRGLPTGFRIIFSLVALNGQNGYRVNQQKRKKKGGVPEACTFNFLFTTPEEEPWGPALCASALLLLPLRSLTLGGQRPSLLPPGKIKRWEHGPDCERCSKQTPSWQVGGGDSG